MTGSSKEGATTKASVKRWNPLPFLVPRLTQSSSSEADNAVDDDNTISNAHQDADTKEAPLETALIVLNTPIVRKDIFSIVWKNASLKFCADGGANRLLDAFGEDESFVPDLIKGDLDSLKDSTRRYYESKNVPIIQDGDQYATDMGKCIQSLVEAEEKRPSQQSYQLVIYGGLSGRFDQTAHTLHALYKLRKEREWAWIVSEESVSCILDEGKHELYMPKAQVGKTCGILPLGVDSAIVSTTGLEWNLDATETSFDTMVSTSNHLIDEVVTLETNRPVVWTAELRP